jgi:hypothetical protein
MSKLYHDLREPGPEGLSIWLRSDDHECQMCKANTLIDGIPTWSSGKLGLFTRLVPIEESIYQQRCMLLQVEGVEGVRCMAGVVPVGEICGEQADGVDGSEQRSV